VKRKERCWTLIGEYRDGVWRAAKRRRISGKPNSVEADWAWTLKREEKRGDVIGFVHTHPMGRGITPSERDIRTMRAWHTALGNPLVCVIDDGESVGGYVFASDDSDGQSVAAITVTEDGVMIIHE
jgi:proteasome lid subunit RPN8/RPN11